MKALEHHLKDHLAPNFLFAALHRVVKKILVEAIAIEVRPPPFRTSDGGEGEAKRQIRIEANQRELLTLLEMCWLDINEAKFLVPGCVHPFPFAW